MLRTFQQSLSNSCFSCHNVPKRTYQLELLKVRLNQTIKFSLRWSPNWTTMAKFALSQTFLPSRTEWTSCKMWLQKSHQDTKWRLVYVSCPNRHWMVRWSMFLHFLLLHHQYWTLRHFVPLCWSLSLTFYSQFSLLFLRLLWRWNSI